MTISYSSKGEKIYIHSKERGRTIKRKRGRRERKKNNKNQVGIIIEEKIKNKKNKRERNEVSRKKSV